MMPKSPPHLVVVGSVNTDLVVSVARFPTPGETVLGSDVMTVPGGKGANQAVAAARLGARVTFIGRIGDDGFGSRMRAHLESENLDLRFLRTTADTPSGIALIAVREGTGENQIIVAPGSNSHLTPEDIVASSAAFDTADAVVLSLEVPLETVCAAATLARARRLPVILNPAPARQLPESLLRDVFLLTPNETEARILLGALPDDAIVETDLLKLGVEAAVVTLGARGAVCITPEGAEHAPGFAVQPVDTVAAGDCFTAAVAVEIASGQALRDAVRFAHAAAAISVTVSGAQPSLPTRAAVRNFLSRNANGDPCIMPRNPSVSQEQDAR